MTQRLDNFKSLDRVTPVAAYFAQTAVTEAHQLEELDDVTLTRTSHQRQEEAAR